MVLDELADKPTCSQKGRVGRFRLETQRSRTAGWEALRDVGKRLWGRRHVELTEPTSDEDTSGPHATCHGRRACHVSSRDGKEERERTESTPDKDARHEEARWHGDAVRGACEGEHRHSVEEELEELVAGFIMHHSLFGMQAVRGGERRGERWCQAMRRRGLVRSCRGERRDERWCQTMQQPNVVRGRARPPLQR